MIGLKTDLVKLYPYDSEWAVEFQKEKERLLELLSVYNLNIQHVGSTSLVGCPAKPVIDIFIGVESLEIAEKIIPVMVQNGYINKINVPNEVYFKKISNGLTTHHIHVADMYGEVWNSQILFRDYLNSHPEILKQYIELKERLASMYPDDRDSYAKGKHQFIEDVIYEAKNDMARKKERK